MAVVLTFGGQTYTVPEGYIVEPGSQPSACRSCRAPILWAETPKGKRAPLDPDGVNHFATCPQAGTWRKR